MEFETITQDSFKGKRIHSRMPESEIDKAIVNIEQAKKSQEELFLTEFKVEHSKIMASLDVAKEKNTQEKELASITSANLELLKTLLKQQQEVSKVKYNIRRAFGEFRTYNHNLELDELGNLNGLVNNSIGKMHKLVADLFKAMYEGVLIPEQISIRHHKICPFRCQYRISDQEFFNMIRMPTNQEAILKTMTNCEQQKVVNQLFEVMKLLEVNTDLIGSNEYTRYDASDLSLNIPLKEPVAFIDTSEHGIRAYLITKICFRGYRITFKGYDVMRYFGDISKDVIISSIAQNDFLNKIKEATDKEEETISIEEENYEYFINNFGEHIVGVGKELEKLARFKTDFIEKAIIQIQNVGSKYLIADQMMQQAMAR
jgi:hypothetical protein